MCHVDCMQRERDHCGGNYKEQVHRKTLGICSHCATKQVRDGYDEKYTLTGHSEQYNTENGMESLARA